MRGLVFGKRTFKEILREPLSYIFCIGFPVVMLVVMTIVNDGIPDESVPGRDRREFFQCVVEAFYCKSVVLRT